MVNFLLAFLLAFVVASGLIAGVCCVIAKRADDSLAGTRWDELS